MIRLLAFLLLGGAWNVLAQALPTSSRAGDLQLGVGYSTAKPDYTQHAFQGFSAYGDFMFRPHLGVEAEFHQVNSTNGDQSYQRTYEIGGRYLHTYRPLAPYVKAMIGRGEYNYPEGLTKPGYVLYAGGAGVDFIFGSHLRIRGEYEFQKWTSFPHWGLTPQIVTFGVAYHFDRKLGHK